MEKRKKSATKPSKIKAADWTTLKGKFFHTFDQDGFVKDQGQVIDLIGEDIAIVLYFEVYVGTPTSHKIMDLWRSTERYEFDWTHCTPKKGWKQYDARQEVSIWK